LVFFITKIQWEENMVSHWREQAFGNKKGSGVYPQTAPTTHLLKVRKIQKQQKRAKKRD